MSFNTNPGIKRGIPKPAIGPQVNPMLQPELQPQGNRSKIMMKSHNNANTNSDYSPNPKTSGKRVGGKTGAKRKTDTRTTVPVPWKHGGNSERKSKLTISQSDFGYDINGSNSPNDYSDERDQTLFRDYNVRSQLKTTTESGMTNTFSQITNQIKSLTIDPKEANNSPGYLSAMAVIFDMIRRDVVGGTRAAKGALDVLEDLPIYLNKVPIAFAVLIQIESLQAWSPSDNAYYDRCFRLLASKMSSTEILELRTQLRQVLIPHILPIGWMKYIKWIYSPHLRNQCPESTKLRFLDARLIGLTSKILNNGDITDFQSYVTSLVTDIRNLNQSIPAIILDNVSSVEFANCKDWYDDMHNSASYDSEWNNIFNNRRIVWRSNTSTSGELVHYPTAKDNYYLCLDTVRPYSMVLADASRQFGPGNPGLPLEGRVEVTQIVGNNNLWSRFCITESDTGVFQLSPVHNISQDNTDSVHRAELEFNTTAITLTSHYSMPAGIQSLSIIASDANCQMAARESLSHMTLK